MNSSEIQVLIESVKNKEEGAIDKLLETHPIDTIVDNVSYDDFLIIMPLLVEYTDNLQKNNDSMVGKTQEKYKRLLNCFDLLTDEQKQEVKSLGQEIYKLTIKNIKNKSS